MSKTVSLDSINSIYFIGIGGVSMSSLAFILKNLGKNVSGYDMKSTEMTDLLEKAGIPVDFEQKTNKIDPCDTVVFTAAIKEDDKLLLYAAKNKKSILTRAELLGMITENYNHSIGVSGTHGKSTTTGFVTQILLSANSDATILSGAGLPVLGGMYRVGNGEVAAFEACEYKNSYHHMHPTVKVVLNCELDHVDFFHGIDDIVNSFTTYLNIPGKNGKNFAAVNADNANAVKAAKASSADVKYFSIANKADMYAKNIDLSSGFGEYDLVIADGRSARVKLSVPGMHNVSNSVGAALACSLCGIDFESIVKGLSEFTGVKRRFEKIGTLPCGTVVIDDYAHHPDEIRVTLETAKKICRGKVICIFQPHTYSRTKALMEDFASVLSICDKAILSKIYPAREPDTFGVSSADLAARISGAECFDSFSEIASYVQSIAGSDDMIITMGAGDVYKISDYFLFG